MSKEENQDAGYQVASDYEQLKISATKIFQHIPKRKFKHEIKKELIIDELVESASQRSIKYKEIEKEQIVQCQE